MSDSEVESNSLFKCDVCLNDYGQSRQQKFLPCLHSFCQSCLTEIQQVDGGIKCPICREVHVDSRDVPSLPSNYFEAMKKMQEKMEGETNKIISLCTEIDKKNSALIQKLEHELVQKIEHFKSSQNFVKKTQQMNEDLLKELIEQKSRFEGYLEMKSKLIMILERTISEQKLVIHLLKEQVASLEEEKH